MNPDAPLEEAAHRYRQEGYTVEVRPSGPALPCFLDRFQPDLVARKNGEQVVVAVRSMMELRGNQEITRLAGVVNAEPGWRFDLVVPAPRLGADEAWAEAREPTEADIHAFLDEAEKLLGLQLLRPAFVAAWTAVEAAMRLLARKEQVPLALPSPRFVLDALYSVGVVGRADYDRLTASLRWRDAAIHGLQPNGLGTEQTAALLNIARRFLEWAPDATDIESEPSLPASPPAS